jgi:hypothetical protein
MVEPAICSGSVKSSSCAMKSLLRPAYPDTLEQDGEMR